MAVRFANPVTQYEDTGGDLLIEGFLVFYETGTVTKKPVYDSQNLTDELSNPVKLSGSGAVPNIWLDGNYKVRLHENDGAGGLGPQIWERDPVGESAGAASFGASWASTTIYSVDDIVKGSDGEYYISIINSNQNNDPVSAPAAWSQLEWFNVWNATETYAEDAIVSHGGDLYRSKADGNLNNTPTAASANWDITIIDAGIQTTKLADLSVATAKINDLAVTTGKIADDAVTKAKIGADVAGTGLNQNVDGSIEILGATSADLNANIGGLLYEEVIAGAAVTQFSDIDLTAFPSWNSLRIEMGWVNALASARLLQLYVNDNGTWDTTGTNYNYGYLNAYSTGADNGDSEVDGAAIADIVASQSLIASYDIRLFENYPQLVGQQYSRGRLLGLRSWVKDAIITSLDGLRLSDSAGGASIGVGSYIRIYRG
jgi:hypothetical protein